MVTSHEDWGHLSSCGDDSRRENNSTGQGLCDSERWSWDRQGCQEKSPVTGTGVAAPVCARVYVHVQRLLCSRFSRICSLVYDFDLRGESSTVLVSRISSVPFSSSFRCS